MRSAPHPPVPDTASGSAFWRRDRMVVVFLAVFLVLAFGRCFANMPWCDEGWFFDPVYNWITKGHTGTTVMEGKGFPWEGIERYQFWQPPFHLVVDFVWLKVFGLSLGAFRSLSVAAGLVALLCWFVLLKHYRAPLPVRWLAMALIASDYAFCRAGSDGRTDMLSAAFGLGGLCSYVVLREKRFGWAILVSQTLIVCGCLTHPIGVLPCLVMIGYVFVTSSDWRRWRWAHLPLVLLPYAAGLGGWGIYVAEDPALFRRIFFGSTTAGRLNGLLNPLLALKNEIVLRYLTPFGLQATSPVVRAKLVIPCVYLAASVIVWATAPLRRRAYLRPFLAMWAIFFLCLLFLDNQRNGTYLVHIFPLYAIFLAALAWWLWESHAWTRRWVALAVAGFISLQAGGSLYVIATNPFGNQYMNAVTFVQNNHQPGDRIVATAEMGFGLGFDNIHDDLALGYYVNRRPDVIVIDQRYREFILNSRSKQPELHGFLVERLGQYRRAFRNDEYEVYLRPDRGSRLPVER